MRCAELLEEVTRANGSEGKNSKEIIQWSNVSVNVARSFMRYLYGGYLDLELESLDEWDQAKNIGEKYELELWQKYVETIKEDFDQTMFM